MLYILYIYIYISLLSKLFLFPQLQLLREGIRLVTFLPRLTVGGEVPVPERSHETRRGISHSASLKKQRPLQGPISWRYHIHDIYIMYIYNVYIYNVYIYMVGGLNHLEKYESQWEGLSHMHIHIIYYNI